MNMQNILVMFGGISSEHEVSVITGLQVVENMDKEKYNALALKIDKKGQFLFYPGLSKILHYQSVKPVECDFVQKTDGTYLVTRGLVKKQYKIDCVYLAFHGGYGEDGAVQGFCDMYGLPFTSASVESSAICMNKHITKVVAKNFGVNVLKDVLAMDVECKEDNEKLVKQVVKELGLPVIVKPVHLGSTIGVKLAHTEIELEKFIMETAFIDTEIMFEKFVDKKAEYNVSVRRVGVELQTSVIERPISKNEVLTFDDKYANGSKKTGGMAGLDREIPAKIDSKLESKILTMAKAVYSGLRCSGNVRIDFIQDQDGEIYLLEPNTIPGSVAFYLWEASGVSFTEQITGSIEQAILEKKNSDSKRFEYETDIVEKFVSAMVTMEKK